MLRFFREKAAYIGCGIVIFFLATMFAGGLFLGFGPKAETNQKKENKSFFLQIIKISFISASIKTDIG